MIEQWLNNIKISKSIITSIQNPENFNNYINKNNNFKIFFNKKQLLDNQYFSFDSCATNIIDRLFKENVDDDTLVITTGSEHPSVVNNLIKCKNVIKLIRGGHINYNELNIDNILQYKKIFVYTIAVSSGDSCFTPNSIITQLKTILKNIPTIFVLDAVQELFLTPRDYSIFDYVIGTAHALIPNYNQGIVISKDKPYCSLTQNNTLFNLLLIIKKLKSKLSLFSYMMYQEFGYELLNDNNLCVSNCCSPYIFNLEDKLNRLCGINDDYINYDSSLFAPATFRAFPALFNKNKFLNKIKQTHLVLKL